MCVKVKCSFRVEQLTHFGPCWKLFKTWLQKESIVRRRLVTEPWKGKVLVAVGSELQEAWSPGRASRVLSLTCSLLLAEPSSCWLSPKAQHPQSNLRPEGENKPGADLVTVSQPLLAVMGSEPQRGQLF